MVKENINYNEIQNCLGDDDLEELKNCIQTSRTSGGG